jgi:hypothetical protein
MPRYGETIQTRRLGQNLALAVTIIDDIRRLRMAYWHAFSAYCTAYLPCMAVQPGDSVEES